MIDRDADRLELLDRIEKRIPELDLDQHQVDWTTLADGHEALLVDGAGSTAARARSLPRAMSQENMATHLRFRVVR